MNEYVGELIDDEECKRRLKQQHDDDVNDFYMLTLDRGRYVERPTKVGLYIKCECVAVKSSGLS